MFFFTSVLYQMQSIQKKIPQTRGFNVMIPDVDLTDIFQIESMQYKEAVRRILNSLFEDFMLTWGSAWFVLNCGEYNSHLSQLATFEMADRTALNIICIHFNHCFRERGVSKKAIVNEF